MNCIIIEDQLPAQRILKRYIEDIGTLHLVGAYSDAIQAIQLLNSRKIDIIFLDIHLPKLSGIDFLKSLSNPPQVILTTAFSDYALESYEFSVVDYLLKPFSFQRFVKAVSKLSNPNLVRSESNNDPYPEIFVKSGYEHIKINIDEIHYINSDSDYTDIYVKNNKYVSSESLKYWAERLTEYNFMRVHKSYIINLDKIEKISGNRIYLLTDIPIPIGRTYKKLISERLTQ